MPWYWTDDLARTLIETGKVEEARVTAWLATPIAIRRPEAPPAEVAGALLEDDGEASPPRAALAA